MPAALGHGLVVNLTNFLPYVFQFNPVSVKSDKQINYNEAPNIGGSSRRLFFSGFGNQKAAFSLHVMDMEDPTGVQGDMAYWNALRNPAATVAGISGSFFGNENYPPPSILFQFGVSVVPLPWKVKNVGITLTHFMSGVVGGLIGIPKRAIIDVQLELDEESDFFKAQRIADKMTELGGSAESLVEEAFTTLNRARRELPGILPGGPAEDS